jgi:hypothetical protein
MKFVVYADDGINQISKIENGYLSIDAAAPNLSKISPNGYFDDKVILKCDNPLFSGQSSIKIETDSAKDITSISVHGFKIEKDDTWVVRSSYIKFNIPCADEIIEGPAKIIVSKGAIDSNAITIYISNGSNTTINKDNPSDLPDATP